MGRRWASLLNRRPGQRASRGKPLRAQLPEKSDESESPQWWHKPIVWAGGVGTVVVAGVLVNVLTPPAQRLAVSAQPAVTAMPLITVRGAASASKRHGRPKPSPAPTTPPLSVVSEDPLSLDDLGVWAFPSKISLSPSQLAYINALQRQTMVNVNLITRVADYFYALGGYGISADTQIVLQNNSNQPVSILDLRVIKNCEAPLSGTLFDSPPQSSDSEIRIGFNLDSGDTDAESAKGWDTSIWKPDYFESKYISFRPGEQRVLNIRAVTARHACTFSYQATVLEGKKKFYQTIDDDGHPFRVNAIVGGRPNAPCARYASLYVGGALTMLHRHGGFVQKNPKTDNAC